MVVPLLLIMVLPKLMNAADADTQKVNKKSLSGRPQYYSLSNNMTSELCVLFVVVVVV